MPIAAWVGVGSVGYRGLTREVLEITLGSVEAPRNESWGKFCRAQCAYSRSSWKPPEKISLGLDASLLAPSLPPPSPLCVQPVMSSKRARELQGRELCLNSSVRPHRSVPETPPASTPQQKPGESCLLVPC